MAHNQSEFSVSALKSDPMIAPIISNIFMHFVAANMNSTPPCRRLGFARGHIGVSSRKPEHLIHTTPIHGNISTINVLKAMHSKLHNLVIANLAMEVTS